MFNIASVDYSIRAMEKQRGMAFGFQKMATAVKKKLDR
jgi:hypothetical protein